MAKEQNFSGQPQAIWLTEPGRPDRDMQLTSDFWYRDWNSRQWNAPANTVVDGASIPKPLWALVGSPYTGDYRRASIVHDVACRGADNAQRRAADKMFYQACRDGGCKTLQAIMLYIGVRIGAWAKIVPQWQTVEFEGPQMARTLEAEMMERDYSSIASTVVGQGETDDVDEIERRVDLAASAITKMNLLAM